MKPVNVVVLGGGLVGCAAAYYLARRGAGVLLVEQGDLNREASGRNAGSLHFQLEYRLIRYGDELAAQFAQIIPLSLVALEDWRGLEAELRADLEVGMHGGLIVAESDADVALLERRQALQEKWGLASQLLSAAEVRRMAPYLAESVIAAGYFPHEGHANPRLVAPAFARRAEELGVTIQSQTRVTGLMRDGAQWVVTVVDRSGRAREVIADAVLNAAGAWAGEIGALAHLHLPIFAVPLSMNVIERAAPLIPHLVQHASQRLTLKQVAAGNVLVGGGWPSRFSREGSAMSTQRRADPVVENVMANLTLAARLVPAIGGLHLLRSWTGITGITTDQMPLLGAVPEAPGFFVAAGGAAFTHGPTYARLVSELILEGRPSVSIDLYSPARFSHINNFMASV
ncbi:NAD(P)/FAD-dependent oxidoreductase [Steroidobacter agaridevorans]|uniref:NAD(P)/FAD-dependent oxidoreductase n=1 Tax=Steroidobacter agaridevorans TaxID=2695856 RepID=UPI00132C39E3|nr:FAD-binding oxidoreductase [Steroidobacter agaridevorans]GFE90410.1 FAD-binding oxidoreductase [Steroidobacter agaridevorans]